MARDMRTPRRPTGPSRPRRRPRATASPASASVARPAEPTASTPARTRPRGSTLLRRPKVMALGITKRAFAVFAVVLVLGLSYAGSLRVWLVQSQELRTAQDQIAQRTERVGQLQSELARWEDPAFVKAQARTRLGWVVPGEVGYRVLGPDGKVLSGNEAIDGVGDPHDTGLEARWWDRLAASLEKADEPPIQPAR